MGQISRLCWAQSLNELLAVSCEQLHAIEKLSVVGNPIPNTSQQSSELAVHAVLGQPAGHRQTEIIGAAY